RLPALKYIVAFEPSIYQPGIMRLETLTKIGRDCVAEYPREFRDEAGRRAAGDIATIIYTSGTTGASKGAMLTHRNMLSNIEATSQVLPLSPGDVELSFLPLSHIFQRHLDYAAMYAGSTIAYAGNMTT